MDDFKIGQRLRAARRAAGMTQVELGKVLGTPSRWILRREVDECFTTVGELRAWAKATGADPLWLLDMGGSPPVMQVHP
jgi:transcriptional regulator with XRE-family HTH domain